ncbi:MAG: hypothetical protein HQ582_29795 [Planctomycetes bacterium]|nr:hypothetical protein [Planctomycetota bacterium]
MTDPADKEALEPWQRFTLLDAFLLQAAFAVGFSVAFSLLPTDGPWGYRVFAAVPFGAVAAAPIILIAQWVFRGRRKLPTVGEQLWLASSLCWAAGICLTLLLAALDIDTDFMNTVEAGTALVFPMCALVIVQTVFSGAAFMQLVKRKTQNQGNPVACKWTDRFGSLACLSLGLWLWIPSLMTLVDLIRQ